ncbi:MAG: tetratricopeptide repeat protein [Chitinophagaceae bacterium]|nr:tetratricopeptide repeat protein [Chitinophagaceae bacterium]
MKRNPLMLAIGLMAFSHAFAQKADSSEFYFQKGIEEKAAKRFLQAAAYLDTAIQFNSKYKEAYIENGYVSLEMHKTDKAISNFNKVLELEPSNIVSSKELMELYYNYRQFSKAKEMANKCTSCLNSEKIKAMCSYNEEDYDNAVKGLTNYLSKNPTDADATYTLARSYLDMEDYKNAIPFYNKAVVLNGEKNMWMYELGLLYYSQEDYKNAVVFFNKAAEKGYPQKSDFVENLGYAYMFSGQTDQGEKLLLGLLEKKPNNKELLRDMAEAFYTGRMYQKSLNYCQKLMEMDGKDGKALYQAGLCFQKLGEKDKGQGMCDKAIEIDPSLNGLRQKQMTMGL